MRHCRRPALDARNQTKTIQRTTLHRWIKFWGTVAHTGSYSAPGTPTPHSQLSISCAMSAHARPDIRSFYLLRNALVPPPRLLTSYMAFCAAFKSCAGLIRKALAVISNTIRVLHSRACGGGLNAKSGQRRFLLLRGQNARAFIVCGSDRIWARNRAFITGLVGTAGCVTLIVMAVKFSP